MCHNFIKMKKLSLKADCHCTVGSSHSRDSVGDEIRPPQDDLGLRARDAPEALVVEEEDEVAAAEAAVAEDGAGVTDVAHQGAAQLVGQGLELEA